MQEAQKSLSLIRTVNSGPLPRSYVLTYAAYYYLAATGKSCLAHCFVHSQVTIISAIHGRVAEPVPPFQPQPGLNIAERANSPDKEEGLSGEENPPGADTIIEDVERGSEGEDEQRPAKQARHFGSGAALPGSPTALQGRRNSPVDADGGDGLDFFDPLEDDENDEQGCVLEDIRRLPEPNKGAQQEPEEEQVPQPPAAVSRIDHIRVAQQYIELILAATINNDKLNKSVKERLRNPPQVLADIDDPDTRLSLDIFMATTHASNDTYQAIRATLGESRAQGAGYSHLILFGQC
ncbi:hypothetical protein AAF712_011428 [Marasmius tenuissimus]|uniref:Uncharacterized protein n=1 Tax=Marasmius tenuissimus TaxID=585030 RepID=A0ABR2ZL46_9AGAR